MIILEIQRSNSGETATICTFYADRNTAEQMYHAALASAAVSNVNVHSVVMLDEVGNRVKGESYYHGELA